MSDVTTQTDHTKTDSTQGTSNRLNVTSPSRDTANTAQQEFDDALLRDSRLIEKTREDQMRNSKSPEDRVEANIRYRKAEKVLKDREYDNKMNGESEEEA